MLVLSRKSGERIRIGNDVVLTLLKIGPGRVQIGFEAPREVRIIRDELHEIDAPPASPNAAPSVDVPRRASA